MKRNDFFFVNANIIVATYSAIFLAENLFEEKCVRTDRDYGHQSQWQDISRLDERGQVVIES